MTKQKLKIKKQELKNMFIDICKKLIILLGKIIGDLSVFIGLCLINVAMYEISKVLGLIVSGGIFITLGYLININKRGDN